MDTVKCVEKKGGLGGPHPQPLSRRSKAAYGERGAEEEMIRGALAELVRGFGHEPGLISVEDLQGIADKLSQVAGKDPPWGWRYLRNLLNGKIEASEKMGNAVMALGATLDGVPVLVARGHPVQVLAVGEVKPGSVVLGSSRACARPGCMVHFVPRVPWQKWCSKECKHRDHREHRDEKRKEA